CGHSRGQGHRSSSRSSDRRRTSRPLASLAVSIVINGRNTTRLSLPCLPAQNRKPRLHMATDTDQQVLIVTGMSGAGRSTVGNALEDLGWYVVDNLPPQMLRPLVELAGHAGNSLPQIAAIVDVRGGKLFADALEAVTVLKSSAFVRVLFLEATDATL